MAPASVAEVDALLPQTQCGRCGHGGCRPYAEAIVAAAAPINRCPPGGQPTLLALAELLQVAPTPLDARCGPEETVARVARVVEADCIGCARCLDACPVDAIVGARQRMHTVIDAECTGCELCLPACPVDCIVMAPRQSDALLARERAAHSRRRFEARGVRLALDRRGARVSAAQVSVASLLAAAQARKTPADPQSP